MADVADAAVGSLGSKEAIGAVEENNADAAKGSPSRNEALGAEGGMDAISGGRPLPGQRVLLMEKYSQPVQWRCHPWMTQNVQVEVPCMTQQKEEHRKDLLQQKRWNPWMTPMKLCCCLNKRGGRGDRNRGWTRVALSVYLKKNH